MEVARVDVPWRMLRFTSRAEVWITFTPGTLRRMSPKFWLGAVARVAALTTDIVTGAFARVDSTLDAETTTVSPRPAIFNVNDASTPPATSLLCCEAKLGMETLTL